MSELAKEARRKNREKAERMTRGDPRTPVDASGYSPPGDMDNFSMTGERPVSRRQFKRGGKVEGDKAKARADRKPRASVVKDYVNRDVREANEERDGTKHIGGFKRGGHVRTGNKRPHMMDGGSFVPTERFGFSPTTGSAITRNIGLKRGGVAHPDEAQDKALIRKEVKPSALKREAHASGGSIEAELGTRPKGGREARKNGGGNWIAGAIKHKGALHKELHVPEGEKIPAKKLAKAEHSDNPKLAKRARLAETLKGLNRKARKDGGRAKGKTTVNVIITQKDPQQPMPMRPPMGPPPVPPTPPMMPPAGAMPPMPPNQPAPPMPRKRGGRTVHMEAGAGSGLGRLEKIKAY